MPGHLRLANARDGAGELPIRVLLAENHPGMRRSLRLLLESDPRIELIAEAPDLASTREQVRLLRPDVIVLDLRLPDGSSIEAIGELRGRSRLREVVALTMQDSPVLARRAHESGAAGFVVKDTADTELCEAVLCAARGQRYTSPRVRPRMTEIRLAAG